MTVHDFSERRDFKIQLMEMEKKLETLRAGGGGDYSDGMEARIAKIESDIGWIKRWLSGLTALGVLAICGGLALIWGIYAQLATAQGTLGAIGAKLGIGN